MTEAEAPTLGTRMSLVGRYTLFAAIAVAVNIATQELAVQLYAGTFQIALSIAAGTATGLFVKYVLDKRYIFRFAASGLDHDIKLFFLYSLMGVATTAIFWGTEYLFHVLFTNRGMRYVGAIIGLAIGYYIKYLLDKRFVFISYWKDSYYE